MLLQILITHYKEKDSLVKELLDSIATQKRVDWKEVAVSIINDGDEVLLDTTDFYKYPFKINYFVEEHAGVSKARQIVFNKTKSDYVTWFDCDDMFYSDYDLSVILQYIKDFPDTNIFAGLTALETKNKLVFMNIQNWVHGYIFKRKFLTDYKLEWNPKLITHEDWYFTRLCKCFTTRVTKIPAPVYLFREIQGSVTRQEDYDAIGCPWELLTFNDKLFASKELINTLVEKQAYSAAANYVFIQTFIAWLNVIIGSWDGEYCKDTHIKETIVQSAKDLWNNYAELRKNYLTKENIMPSIPVLKPQFGMDNIDDEILLNNFYKFIGEKE